MDEPVLGADDRHVWQSWWRAAAVHSRTNRHRRAVDTARRIASDALSRHQSSCAMWSGGKDSTAMVAMLHDIGHRGPVITEKDDLDYPCELEYVQAVGAAVGVNLEVLVPKVSPSAWMAEHGREFVGSTDMHSRAAELSKICFYNEVEQANAAYELVFLGLRRDESRGRKMNAITHGPTHTRRDGRTFCSPLTWWSGLDVYAYLWSRGIEPLHVYKCVALMHADEPWRVRKSWWIPGASSRHGGTVWLRHYYPSLFAKLCQWMPSSALEA